MRLRLLSCILLAVSLFPARGEGRTAADFFVDAPDSVFRILDRNTRMDMRDYFENGMATKSSNVFGGKSSLTRVAPEYVEVELTENASATLVMLPQKSDTILAVITTVAVPVHDSSLKFYDAGTWQLLPRQPRLPRLRDFVDGKKFEELGKDAELPPFVFVGISYDPTCGTFVFENTTGGYYMPDNVSEDRRKLLDEPSGMMAMRKKLVYKFRNGKLVRQD